MGATGNFSALTTNPIADKLLVLKVCQVDVYMENKLFQNILKIILHFASLNAHLSKCTVIYLKIYQIA